MSRCSAYPRRVSRCSRASRGTSRSRRTAGSPPRGCSAPTADRRSSGFPAPRSRSSRSGLAAWMIRAGSGPTATSIPRARSPGTAWTRTCRSSPSCQTHGRPRPPRRVRRHSARHSFSKEYPMPPSAQESDRDLFLDLVETSMQIGHDPAPLLHRLRGEDPVHFVAPLGFWFVTRHDDVKRLFNDPENVSQNRRYWEHYAPPPAGTLVHWLQEESRMSQGAEGHARSRRLFLGALTPRAVRRMEAQIREVVERFAAPLRSRAGEVIDLLGDFTNPIPNTVISRIFGVEAGADEERFRDLAQEMIRAFFPFAPPESLALAENALQEMAPWVRRMVAERRGVPREDLISDLLRDQEGDLRITDDEIVMIVSILIGA